MKYIIELEKIEGTELFKARGANTLVFDNNGINNILKPYEEPKEPEEIPQDDEGIYKQYICPACERHLTYGNPKPYERPHHCRCGQLIDWSKE